jgi:ribA/ribD-fused uncharacterized protein
MLSTIEKQACQKDFLSTIAISVVKVTEQMTEDICFLKVKEPNGFCSNFYPAPVRYGGQVWKCNEYLYQAQKHRGTPYYDELFAAPNAWSAMKMGRVKPVSVPNWDDLKDDNMRVVNFLKFIQHPDLGEQLTSTGLDRIVEAGGHDSYWAEGPDGKGLNRLGIILMEIRTLLQRHKGTAFLNSYVSALADNCGMTQLQKSDLDY